MPMATSDRTTSGLRVMGRRSVGKRPSHYGAEASPANADGRRKATNARSALRLPPRASAPSRKVHRFRATGGRFRSRRTADGGVERREVVRRSDVRPGTVVTLARNDAASDPFAVERKHPELHPARKLAEERAVVQADVAEREPLAVALVDALAGQHEIAARVIGWIGHHYEMHARRRVRIAHRRSAQRERRVVEAREDVARYDDDRPGREQVGGGRDAAGGFERLGLARIADSHAVRGAVAERVDDRVGAMRDVDRDVAKAGARERLDL